MSEDKTIPDSGHPNPSPITSPIEKKIEEILMAKEIEARQQLCRDPDPRETQSLAYRLMWKRPSSEAVALQMEMELLVPFFNGFGVLDRLYNKIHNIPEKDEDGKTTGGSYNCGGSQKVDHGKEDHSSPDSSGEVPSISGSLCWLRMPNSKNLIGKLMITRTYDPFGPDTPAHNALLKGCISPGELKDSMMKRVTKKTDGAGGSAVRVIVPRNDLDLLVSYIQCVSILLTCKPMKEVKWWGSILLQCRQYSKALAEIKSLMDNPARYEEVKRLVDPELGVIITSKQRSNTLERNKALEKDNALEFFMYLVKNESPLSVMYDGLSIDEVIRLSHQLPSLPADPPGKVLIEAKYKGEEFLIDLDNEGLDILAGKADGLENPILREFGIRLHEFLDSQLNRFSPLEVRGRRAYIGPCPEADGNWPHPLVRTVASIYTPVKEHLVIVGEKVTNPVVDLGISEKIEVRFENVDPKRIIQAGVDPKQIFKINGGGLLNNPKYRFDFGLVKAAKGESDAESVFLGHGPHCQYYTPSAARELAQEKYARLLDWHRGNDRE